MARSRDVFALCAGGGARGLAAGMILLLAGCSDPKPPPPPPPPTIANVELSAATNNNMTVDGQGAPVDVRVFQLTSKSAFDRAEFFALYKNDTATLGPDLIKKDAFLLIPGGAKSLNLKPADPVRVIGVFAAYRDFPKMNWRASAEVPAHQTTTLTVTMDSSGIKLAAKSVKPASP
jgi:type VI secretion system protein VasD